MIKLAGPSTSGIRCSPEEHRSRAPHTPRKASTATPASLSDGEGDIAAERDTRLPVAPRATASMIRRPGRRRTSTATVNYCGRFRPRAGWRIPLLHHCSPSGWLSCRLRFANCNPPKIVVRFGHDRPGSTIGCAWQGVLVGPLGQCFLCTTATGARPRVGDAGLP